ncbi:MAG: hypothetical protein H7X91_03525 [Burkholderiales bacterium]|nr:hypothetical protein [Burkholderiales bacterium]
MLDRKVRRSHCPHTSEIEGLTANGGPEPPEGRELDLQRLVFPRGVIAPRFDIVAPFDGFRSDAPHVEIVAIVIMSIGGKHAGATEKERKQQL